MCSVGGCRVAIMELEDTWHLSTTRPLSSTTASPAESIVAGGYRITGYKGWLEFEKDGAVHSVFDAEDAAALPGVTDARTIDLVSAKDVKRIQSRIIALVKDAFGEYRLVSRRTGKDAESGA